MAHEHDYRKLNDDAVFCRGCGDIKSVAPAICTLPHYPVYPYVPPVIYPTVPWWQQPNYPRWIVSTGTTTTSDDITIGNTIYLSPADVDAMSFTNGDPLTAITEARA